MTFEQEIYLQGTNKLVATGEIVWVNTNQKKMKPEPVPDELRDLLIEYQE